MGLAPWVARPWEPASQWWGVFLFICATSTAGDFEFWDASQPGEPCDTRSFWAFLENDKEEIFPPIDGSLTLEAISTGCITGKYEVHFEQGSLSGNFDAVFCAP
jgi:hypothetical protein